MKLKQNLCAFMLFGVMSLSSNYLLNGQNFVEKTVIYNKKSGDEEIIKLISKDILTNPDKDGRVIFRFVLDSLGNLLRVSFYESSSRNVKTEILPEISDKIKQDLMFPFYWTELRPYEKMPYKDSLIMTYPLKLKASDFYDKSERN